MRIEIVAVGTELLLGQITDTNSRWLGEELAAIGVASHFHQAVGDNHQRIVLALRTALGSQRRGHRLRWPRPDPRRHHPRGHRRGDGTSAWCGTRAWSPPSARCSSAAAARCPSPISARPTCPRGPRPSARPRAPPPASSAPSDTRCSMRSPACPTRWRTCSSGPSLRTSSSGWPSSGESAGVIASRVIRTWGMSESGLAEALAGHIADLDEAAARASGRGHGHRRLSGQRHRGHQGAGHGGRPGPDVRRRTPGRGGAPRSGPSSSGPPATSCSASTTRPSRTPWPRPSWTRASPSAWPSP